MLSAQFVQIKPQENIHFQDESVRKIVFVCVMCVYNVGLSVAHNITENSSLYTSLNRSKDVFSLKNVC